MDAVAARVRAFVDQHALLPTGERVLCMVSGGADSTALLHLLAQLHDGPVVVLSVDHGLRAAAAGEAAAVCEGARRLGLHAQVSRLGLQDGPNLQARARAARYAAAEVAARELGATRIATGHTADDQAETVLFRIARGTGRTGALGIAPRSANLIRPLLSLTRAETAAFCDERGLRVVDDPANTDPRFTRTRVRADLLGALKSIHPGAENRVAAFAEQLRDEAELLEPIVDAAWQRCATGDGLTYQSLRVEPLAVQRLLIRRLMQGLELGQITRVLELRPGAPRIVLPNGVLASCEDGIVRVEREALPPPPVDLAPGAIAEWAGYELDVTPGLAGASGPLQVGLSLGVPAILRGARNGDRLPLGNGGHASVASILASRAVAPRSRAWSAVVEQSGRVVWVVGQRAAPGLLAPAGGDAIIVNLRSSPPHGAPHRKDPG